jgi:hypothetical protein
MNDSVNTHRRAGTLKRMVRLSLVGGWAATVAVVVAASVAMGADGSTTALLLAVGIAPALVMLHLARNGPSLSVAEILHAVDAKGGRS